MEGKCLFVDYFRVPMFGFGLVILTVLDIRVADGGELNLCLGGGANPTNKSLVGKRREAGMDSYWENEL